MKMMKKRWDELWATSGAVPDGSLDADAAFRTLMDHYSERCRSYHGVAHINHCLTEALPVRSQMEDWVAVELALWFHDVIYETRQKNSEEMSAQFAFDMLSRLRVRQAEDVAGLIRMTTHRARLPISSDADYVVDIDLAIFGQPEPRFSRYETQIREEYKWVPYERYADGRSALLRQFLDRPRIYRTLHFRQRYEARARRNLERSIRKLTHGY